MVAQPIAVPLSALKALRAGTIQGDIDAQDELARFLEFLGISAVNGTDGLGTGDRIDDLANSIGSGLQAGYDTLTELEADIVNTDANVVAVAGSADKEDGGGGFWVRQASEPTYEPKTQDANNVWFTSSPYIFTKRPVLSVREFGVFGNDTFGSLTDEGTEMLAAVTAAARQGYELYWPETQYMTETTLTLNNVDIELYMEGVGGGRPLIHMGSTLAAAGGYLFRFEIAANGGYKDSGGTYSLAEDLAPNLDRIRLNTTAGLAKGDLLEITSNATWYYTESTGLKGEIHLISEVIDSEYVRIDGHTWDAYDVESMSPETITIRVISPKRFVMNNMGLIVPNNTANPRPMFIDGFYRPQINDCLFRGGGLYSLADHRSWGARFEDIEVEDTGADDGQASYAIQLRSSVGGKIDGMKIVGGRAGIDMQDRSDAGPIRDWDIMDATVNGGGANANGTEYFPGADSQQNRGFSTHGGAEHIRFRNCKATCVETGWKIRGRDVTIDGCTASGPMEKVIDATQGAGLRVQNTHYLRADYPDKIASQALDATYNPTHFIQMSGTTSAAEWKFEAPTVIENCSIDAVQTAFLGLDGTVDPANIFMRSISVVTYVDAPGVFNIVDATNEGAGITISNSHIDFASISVKNYGSGTVNQFDSTITYTQLSISPQFTALTLSTNLVAQEIFMNDVSPAMNWYETDAGTNAGRWRVNINNEQFLFQVRNDADDGGTTFLSVDRTATNVDDVTITADAITLAGAADVTGDFTAVDIYAAQTWFSAASPKFNFEETDAGTNEKRWRINVNNGIFLLQTRTDADGAGASFLQISRTGTTVDKVRFDATELEFNGTTLDVNAAADFSSTVTIAGDVTAANLGTASAEDTGTSGNAIPFLDGANTWSGNQTFSAKVNLGTPSTVTISAGAVTISKAFHRIDTSGGASEDLNTINGGAQGDIVVFRTVSSARDVVFKDGGGNIRCGADRTLGDVSDTIMLINSDGSNWELIAFADN